MRLKNKDLLFYSALLLIVSSCRKSELPIKPYDRGDVITTSVDMNPDYKQQLFFSLSSNKIITSNLKTDWDMAFESAPGGSHIKINSSKLMCVFNTGQSDFNSVTDTLGFGAAKKFDYPTGNLDSTAFGMWQDNSPVYIVDKGYNASGMHLGYKKLKLLSVSENEYSVKTANLDGGNEVMTTIPKNSSDNFVYFSLASNSVLLIEPGKEEYDLIFTQYTHLYFDPFEPYLVTGVLSNPNKVKIAPINDKPFSEIVLSDTIAHPFYAKQNVIGYNWKTYSFQTSSYVVDEKRCYIIRNVNGFYYKLHFIGFYNSSGIKGFPKFEFRKL